MKNIVTTTSVFPPCSDEKRIVARLKDCSFTHLDLAFDYCTQDPSYPFMTDGYESWALSLREECERLGVKITHSHAPFDASGKSFSGDRNLIEKSIRCASILGIKYMVVHPIWEKAHEVFYEGDEFLSVNINAIKPIVELAQKHGVIVLSENLLWGDSARSSVISRLVSEIGSPYFGWCYDTGHAHAMGEKIEELFNCKEIPLSLHVQDSFYGSDSHLIPGDGEIDFKKLLSVLKRIGYKGELVLEAHHQSLDADDSDRESVLKKLHARAYELFTLYQTL